MGKQKFQCRTCGAILVGGRARREHCQTHHPSTAFGKLDVYFPMEYKEINDDEIASKIVEKKIVIEPNTRQAHKVEPQIGQATSEPLVESRFIQNLLDSAILNKDNVFITGKAGTGKTTLLRKLKDQLESQGKKVAVVAPTGVAAKNADGVTIHSFLRLPTTPYLPNAKVRGLYSLKPEGELVVRNIDVIIIDEISMVRCDMLDMMDDVLRHYRKNDKLFGGVQIIAFGDLYQLMPVVTREDWTLMKEWYRTLYFFSSKAYEATPFKMITLKKVYRQDDSDFIELLNEVRLGNISPRNLIKLQQRYDSTYADKVERGVIRLTTHNRLAKAFNNKVFESLPGEQFEYKAEKDGYVHPLEFPTSSLLALKKGARVMFIKNDTASGQYVNGTLGVVMKCTYEGVIVRLDSGKTIMVTPQTWYFEDYYYDRKNHTLEKRIRGAYTQIPLRLAWAVTIHKSQGLTFDKVVIDAGKAFAYGQVYVALSRCRRFDGIRLATQISSDIIKTDPIVKYFMDPKKDNDEIPAFQIPKRGTRKPKVPKELHGLDLLAWMAQNDFTIEEMSEQTNQVKGLIYHDLCKLIEKGKFGIASRLSKAKINDMKQAWLTLGLDAEITDIKPLCSLDVNFGEIQMVRSHLRYMKKKNRL